MPSRMIAKTTKENITLPTSAKRLWVGKSVALMPDCSSQLAEPWVIATPESLNSASLAAVP